ncbi:MAG: GAF domain-containing protein [Gemmatimonadetes bacterium]|nr:GAF domain-containing protein [Gemmatimonadota bacterium]
MSATPVGFTRASGSRWERHPAYRSFPLEAYLGVAIVVDTESYGTLSYSSRSPRAAEFTEQEITIVRLMGQWIGYELMRQRTEARLQRKDVQLERLLAATHRMNTDLTIDRVLQEVADSAVKVLDCRYAALGVLDQGGKGLARFIFSGLSEQDRERIGPLPTGKGLLGLLVTDPRPHRITDIRAHSISAGFPDGHPEMKSFLGVPILGPDGPIGNLYCTEKQGADQFSEEDESTAQVLAAEAALAIENARLLTQLRTLQVTRNRFYAMVNHELRNALTGVHGWAELMLRKAGDDPPRPVVETVESAEYTLELLNDLLDLSTFDAVHIEAQIADADAAKIVQDAVATVQPSARDAGVTIDVVESGPLPCRTDAKRVRQILINLLRNAVRHSGDDSVTVGVLGDESQLRFSVVDRGEGISPEQQAIIFDAFARAASKVGGGTGLGLTLSRRLATLLDGDITLQSRVGHGARFTVIIARYMT